MAGKGLSEDVPFKARTEGYVGAAPLNAGRRASQAKGQAGTYEGSRQKGLGLREGLRVAAVRWWDATLAAVLSLFLFSNATLQSGHGYSTTLLGKLRQRAIQSLVLGHTPRKGPGLGAKPKLI